MRIASRARGLAAATALAVLALLTARAAAQAPQYSLDAVTAALKDAANHGNFDEDTATELLKDAGVTSPADIKTWLDQLRNTAAGQNASGKGDWNLGQIHTGTLYRVTYPLTNNCKVAQTVSITYPDKIGMQGPPTVDVPPHSTINVPMTLNYTPNPPIPKPPWPLGIDFSHFDIEGDITLTHPQFQKTTETADAIYSYTCYKMQRTHHITANVVLGPPPAAPGGGNPKPTKSQTCETLWNTRNFYPDSIVRQPNDCRDSLVQSALDFLHVLIEPARSANPGQWTWLPTEAQIQQMSTSQLLDFKARANLTAAALK